MKIQFVIHADFELPGIIDIWAKESGFTTNICRPFAGEQLPVVSDFDWLIVMGGPQTPLEPERYPYLIKEIALIRQSVEADKTVLGFCLGAQLIGEAFGARTERSPNKEVGIYPIHLTEEGKQDPLLQGMPSTFSVMHWHNDMPGLTAASKVLAVSDGCPRQIIRYGEKVYGFQCHPESTLSDIKNMIANCADDLVPARYVQTAEEILSGDYVTINKHMVAILESLRRSLQPA
ncbi:MAG: homoserine O-succinyltransferase [Chlamydiales bacterium]|nr:homoserine O-succinyltransferase [Chlamydiales bacterium]